MSSVATVAVVGNIVQFIELAAHVFHNCYQAYKSGYAISSEVIEKKKVIEMVLADMLQIPPMDSSANSAITNNVEGLQNLVKQYTQVAEELLFIMEDVKVKGKVNLWASMISAAKGLRKRKTLEQLLERLELLGSAIILKLNIGNSRDITSIRIDIKEMRQLKHTMRQTFDNSLLPKSLGYFWETSDPDAHVTVDDGLDPIYLVPTRFCVSYQKFLDFLLYKFKSDELPGLSQVEKRHLELWNWDETSKLSADNWSWNIQNHRSIKVSFIMATPFGYAHDLCFRCHEPQNMNTYTRRYNTCPSCKLSLRWVAPDDIPYEPEDTSVLTYHGRHHDHKPEDRNGPDKASADTASGKKQDSSLPQISGGTSEDSGQVHVDLVCRRLTLKWEPIFNVTHRYFACRCVIRRSSPSRFEPEIDILRFAICPRHNGMGVRFQDYQKYEDSRDDTYFNKFGGYNAFRAFIHCCSESLYINLGSERFLAQEDIQIAYESLQTAMAVLGETLTKVHQDYMFELNDTLVRSGFIVPENIMACITAERKERGLDQASGRTDDQFRDIQESPAEKEVNTILDGQWQGKRHWLPGE